MNSISKVPQEIAVKYPSEKWDYFMSTKVNKNKQVYYDCPYCWSAYKKNGERTKRSKRGYHFHGVDKSGITVRNSHCIKSDKPVVIFSYPYYLDSDEIKKYDQEIKVDLNKNKFCRKCETLKPLLLFSKQKGNHRSTCKTCVSSYAKDNYKKNKYKYYTPTGKPRGRPKIKLFNKN
jgi:hypothetical protein